MSWKSTKKIRKADGSPVHFIDYPDKSALPPPGNLRVVPGTERVARGYLDLNEELITATEWIKREIASLVGVPDDPVVKKITENVKKCFSDNPIDKIEGRLYLRKNYPSVLEHLDDYQGTVS